MVHPISMALTLLPHIFIPQVFVVMSLMQGTTWMVFSTIPEQTKDYYQINAQTVNLLLNWATIVYLPSVMLNFRLLFGRSLFFFFDRIALFFLSHPRGLTLCVRLGSFFTLLSCVIRIVPSFFSESYRTSSSATVFPFSYKKSLYFSFYFTYLRFWME